VKTTETPAATDLLAGLVAGLCEVSGPLAATVDQGALLECCRQLAHLHWTPLMLERWASNARWRDVGPAAFLEAVQDLRFPAEAPRSAVPAPGNVCPEHGAPMPGQVCDVCLSLRTPGPPAGWRDRQGPPSEARCERSDLLASQCAHCLGHEDRDVPDVVDAGSVRVIATIQARFAGKCALDDRHLVEVAEIIGRTEHGWICARCVGAAGVKA
jgi:hypothetical protein